MEVLNISMDQDEYDTSQEAWDNWAEDTQSDFFDLDEICPKVRDLMKKDSFTTFCKPVENWRESKNSTETQLEDFRFFVTDVTDSVSKIGNPGICKDEKTGKNSLASVIRLFGISESGHSVCCNVHNYYPYFYARPSNHFTTEDIPHLTDALNSSIKREVLNSIAHITFHDFVATNDPIVKMELFKPSQLNNVYDFHLTSDVIRMEPVILKITCAFTRLIWIAGKLLNEGALGYPYTDKPCSYETYEANINSTLKYVTGKNIYTCRWVQLPRYKYCRRSPKNDANPPKESHCQIELDILHDHVKQMEKSHVIYKRDLPPLKILSFDIEVLPGNSGMPRQGAQKVLQIGNTVGFYGNTESAKKVIFTLSSCDPLPDTEILSFLEYNGLYPEDGNVDASKKAESEMLLAWRDFVIAFDPDIITGYNIKKFDLPYLIDRANVINDNGVEKFPYFGRLKCMKTHVRENKSDYKKLNRFDETYVKSYGRIVFDLLPLFMRHDRGSYGRGGYTLDSVSKRYLSHCSKEDVHYSQIEGLQNGSPLSRAKLASYCVQDAFLTFKLIHVQTPNRRDRGDFIRYYVNKAQDGGNLLRYLVNKSQEYEEFVKQLRVQKNPNTATYIPATPSPKKIYPKVPMTWDFSPLSVKPEECPKNQENSQSSSRKRKAKKLLFDDDEED